MAKSSFFKDGGSSPTVSATIQSQVDAAAASAVAAANSFNSIGNELTLAQAARTGSETARDASVIAQTASESARDTATQQAGNASTSAVNAAASESNAQASETNSSSSQVASANSAAAALVSENNSAGSAVTASQQATISTTQAGNAASSAAAASSAQTASETARDASVVAKNASETAKTASEAARDVAISNSTSASSSATAASTSETNSASSETNAAASQSAAAASAASASTSETNSAASQSAAAASAASASTSETNSAASETASQTAQTASETARTASETAKTASEAARDLALSYRNTAEAHKISAASSAAAASSSQSAAATSATGASSSAASAASAQTAAEAARDSALAAFDSFDDRYLGAKVTGGGVGDPTVDNDGNSLVSGALFYDETNNVVKIYTGSAWVAAYVSGGSFANLSGATFTGDVTVPNLITAGNVDGRDVSADGTKLDGIAANATAVTSLTDLSISDGSSGQALKTDGAGNFSFGDVSSSITSSDVTTALGFTPISSADGGNAATLDSLDSTSFLRSDTSDTATGTHTFNDLKADGGNLIIGDDAYSNSADYIGLKTSYQSGSNDYMIISGTSDGNTYISAKDGGSSHLRGGGNNSTNEIVVPDGGNPYAKEKFNIGTNSTLNSTGQLNIYRSEGSPYIGWYSNSTTRGGYLQYVSSDYFLFGEASYSQSEGSFRAPIFYDSNNTSYYTNPAGTSYMQYLGRLAHNTGHLVGSYNSVGSNSSQSNPIYTIGSNYNPSTTTLGNMYGIGYTHTNASFIGFAGSSGWGMYVAADGDARVYLSGQQGSGHFTGNITAYASDERLKTNIKPVQNALEKVCQLRGVEFDWVDNITSEYDFHPQTMHETGVLAQNVAEHIPDAVTEAPMNANYTAKNGTDHQFLTVDKEKIIPVLIEAIKELKAEINMLKGEADV